MAKVKSTFIGKQSKIPVSPSELQVTAAPIPPGRSMTSDENLTEVGRHEWVERFSRPISDSLWMNTILFSGCCCSQTPVTELLQDDIAIIGSSGHTWPITLRMVGNVSCDTESSP